MNSLISCAFDKSLLHQKAQNTITVTLGESDIDFDSNTWRIKHKATNSSVIIDFDLFNMESYKVRDFFEVTYNNKRLSVSNIDMAKLLWLDLMVDKGSSVSSYRGVYDCLALLFYYLKENQLEQLKKSNLEEFYSILLNYNPARNGIEKRFSAPSFGTRISHFHIHHLGIIAAKYGIKCICDTLLSNAVSKALNSACLSVLNVTANEYNTTGSLNFLGLEVGKHYIDHCANIFEEYFQFSAAMRKTLNSLRAELSNNGIPDSRAYYGAAGAMLHGISINNESRKRLGISIANLEKVRDVVCRLFAAEYNKLSVVSQIVKLSTIDVIICKSAMPDRYDTQEFVRSFLQALYVDDFNKSPKKLFSEYMSMLSSQDEVYKYTYSEFCRIVKFNVDDVSHTLSEDAAQIHTFLADMIKFLPRNGRTYKKDNVTHLKTLIGNVESSALVLFVGLTGWRASEYGFNVNNVLAKTNNDVLDNLYTPWRFNVRWVVPKTSGETLVNREITTYAYQILYLANILNADSLNKPSLYMPDELRSVRDLGQSQYFIKDKMTRLWLDFISNYNVFTDLDEIKSLLKVSELSDIDSKRLSNLHSKYEVGSSEYQSLLRVRDTLMLSMPIYELVNRHNNESPEAIFISFRDNTCSHEIRSMLEDNLSPETLEKLKDHTFKIDLSAIRTIRDELLEKAPYPTPHSFRHVWAEAVLMRYKGDVGKFIRANFKHLDERFFMSYLRGKELETVYQLAKRTVINSMVRKHVMAITDQNREYAGGFDVFLSRSMYNTKVLSIEEYEDFTNKISEQRIIDIKANPWATCLLRVGTNKTAKCSEDGIPQRRNAEPKLCLGCVNADIGEGNFNGIVVYLKPDIDACRNPKLPTFVKINHAKTLRIALAKVKQLRENSNNSKYDAFIAYLSESIEMSNT